MFSAKLRTTAALLAVAAGLTFAADAGATRITSKPTGNASLDDYCRQAGDLINEAFAESDRQDARGELGEGAAWWEHALDMLQAAKARGCTFTTVRKQIRGEVTTHSRVGLILTGDQGFDDFCRHAAAAINAYFAAGERDGALNLLEQGRQLGCHLVVTLASNGVAAPHGDIALSSQAG